MCFHGGAELGTEPRRRKRRGSRLGNLRQVTFTKLVLTCHERRRMAFHGEVPLRPRVCAGSGCHAVFWLCPHCDRGHRYCSQACRATARQQQRRSANRRHQQSQEGRLDHRDRQREYRCRQTQARVTDQPSPPITFPASSRCGVNDPPSPGLACLPRWPESRLDLCLCCRICGRTGRLVDPFPRIPRRR